MSSFLISKLGKDLSKENLEFVAQTKNEFFLINIINYVFKQKNKDKVLFLLQTNKIPKNMTKELYDFIIENKFFDLFLSLNYDIFDIHHENDIALRKSVENQQVDVVKFLIEKGANIHVNDDHILRYFCKRLLDELINYLISVSFKQNNDSSSHSQDSIDIINRKMLEIAKLLVLYDKNYFLRNEETREIIKTLDLAEKFLINTQNDVLDFFKSYNMELLKKCEDYHFYKNDYEFFFKALESKNKEMINLIFNKIKRKKNLKHIFDGIKHIFDQEMTKLFNDLFDNVNYDQN